MDAKNSNVVVLNKLGFKFLWTH